jgi:Uncharacterized alpha/beta hydrolase domain (DUF2235)
LLAIDETRDFFKPVYWTGLGPSPDKTVFRTKRTLEQIWMPGVHSDVGGAYDARHLGNLALQTMIDWIVARTDLSFDLQQVRKMRALPDGAGRIRVHNELTGMLARFSGAKPRLIMDVPQTIHPFTKKMMELPINYKTEHEQSFYKLRAELDTMTVAQSF